MADLFTKDIGIRNLLLIFYKNMYRKFYHLQVQRIQHRYVSKSHTLKPFQAIPGPKRWPLLGHLYLFSPWGPYSFEKIMDAFQDLKKKHGPIVKLDLGTTLVALFDPEDIKELFRKNESFPERPVFEALRHYRKSKPNMYKSVGLITDNGENWWRLRHHLNWMLLPECLHHLFPDHVSLAEDFMSRTKLIRNEKNEVDNFLREIYKFTLEASSIICFGNRFGVLEGKEDNPVLLAVEDTLDSMAKTLLGPPIWKLFRTATYKKLERAQDFLYGISKEKIETFKKMNNSSNKCILLNKLINEQKLDDQDVILLILEVFSAGIDTTGNVLAYLLYNLAKNLEKQEILYEEIKNFNCQSDIQKFTYLKACIKESHRLSPSTGGNARILTDDTILSNYKVPRGTVCMGINPIIGWSSEYFSNPESFVPERWIRLDTVTKEKNHPYALLPFGHGRRRCVGQRIAEQEIQIFLIKTLQNFRVEFPSGNINSIMRMQLIPDRPMTFRFIDRL